MPDRTSCCLSFYFLNATSLAKNNAVQHLNCDIRSYNIDVCLIAETWFRPSITDDAVAIDNYVLLSRDKAVVFVPMYVNRCDAKLFLMFRIFR